VTLTFDLLT